MSTDVVDLDDPDDSSPVPATPGHAPDWPLQVAAGAALGSAVTLYWASQGHVLWGMLGYVLGALVTPLMTVAYRLLRRTALKNPWYVPRPRSERLLAVVTGLGIAVGVVHAWFVATELAKR